MAEAAYDAIATWYDESVRNRGGVALTNDLVLEPLFTFVGDARGQRVCDLACGQGVVARELARRGATVIGIDVSEKLLEIAAQIEQAEPLGVIYHRDDAQTLATLDADSFDGVACNMALMDIPDLEALYRAVGRVLRPGGWFVYSITHPCFQTPDSRWTEGPDNILSRTISSYFVEGFWRSDNPNGVRGQVGAYHRTLGTYLNTLADAGLVLERVVEPQPVANTEVNHPGNHVVPACMVVRCRKVIVPYA